MRAKLNLVQTGTEGRAGSGSLESESRGVNQPQTVASVFSRAWELLTRNWIIIVPGLVIDRELRTSESRNASTVPQKSVSSRPRMTSAFAMSARPPSLRFSGWRDGKSRAGSMDDERRERLPDVGADDEIGDVVEVGRIAIEDDEARTGALG